MSINHWKVVSQLKEQLTRTIPEKNHVMILINKEWVNLAKRLPSFATHTPTEQTKVKPSDIDNSDQRHKEWSNFLSYSTYLPQAITDLKSKFSQNPPSVEEKFKWKSRRNIVSDLSINARTRYVLTSVISAESEASRLKRLEDLVEHFLLYPEGTDVAVKNGAVKLLLNMRRKSKEENTLEVIREALTILGYVDPLPSDGIRILSIDGGGVRGLLVMEMLMKLEELTGKRVYEMFDYICGVSTGSIIACTIGATGKSIKDVSELYKELSTKIFTQNAFFGARSLIWSHGYYDTSMWEELLKEHVGRTQLIKTSRKSKYPKIGAISTVNINDQVQPFIFRNYELPYRVRSQYLGSYKYELWEAARASAAAPTYFEEFRLGEFLHHDGGIVVNNPTAVAVHEVKQLWPNSPIQCVVSFGTGRMDPIINASRDVKDSTTKQTSWKDKFYHILISATDTEAVHMILNDLLPPSVYFRFNPYLSEMLSMDEYQPQKLALMQNDARMYIRRNEEKFQEAALALTKSKTVYQKLKDWVGEQVMMYGSKY